jgi:hypothetical protein
MPARTPRTLAAAAQAAAVLAALPASTALASQNPATGKHTTNTLGAVVALSRNNAWAFGFYEKATTSFRTLIERWNGSAWTTAASPSPGSGDDSLSGIAKVPGGGYWAVGSADGATLTEFRC